MAFDTHNIDPEQDLLAYKLGHVIDVKPDGHVWGAQEKLPKFWIVKIPGMAVETAREYLKSLEDLTNPNDPIQIGMRKWKLDYNTLSTPIKKKLNDTGTITVTETQAIAFMTRITTG